MRTLTRQDLSDHRAEAPAEATICAAFVLCANVAEVELPHPVLGVVDACTRCASILKGD